MTAVDQNETNKRVPLYVRASILIAIGGMLFGYVSCSRRSMLNTD